MTLLKKIFFVSEEFLQDENQRSTDQATMALVYYFFLGGVTFREAGC
jgi:hypothetical protein